MTTRPYRARPVPLVVLAIGLASVGCRDDRAPDAIAAPNRVAHETALPAIGRGPALVHIRAGGLSPAAHPWHDAAVSEDGRTLFVRFVHDSCRWLDTAAATESDDRVEVRIAIAYDPSYDNPPDGPLKTCVGTPEYAVTRVELRAPLGGRVVYDAYSGQPRPVEPAR